ncbi:MAG: bifunctional (p)ppGpp synthetase/guanosine-3',5'-bis(diphosphate) 3'-pyrophosphohydrolase, partial [Chloroflexi bacterium]|nr:bifunctional (p)ppGpp synthetase/guanosine-3',5'-bis(diphosphate) 3'-pyrophosphohydrolase [Chloroflexota bacterium]
MIEATHPGSRDQIAHALDFAETAHAGQRRASGEPYITHPFEVALILADLRMDVATITAALLHDVVEDTATTVQQIAEAFDPTVAALVDGVSKLRKAHDKSRAGVADLQAAQAENLRKMFLAMVSDIRVIIIKLADRLHNMRTLASLPSERQRRLARETLDVYAPLANRLGIWQLKWQLEDLAFRYLDPDKYHQVAALLAERRAERNAYLDRVVTLLKERLAREGLSARVSARPKHIFSIYVKMAEKDRSFDEIYDVRGVRVIVKTVPECYHVLGIVHTLWRPIPGEFDDYISVPKDNLYQSLHTAVVALDGKPLEVQIRTEEMNQVAEYGIAAHWRYKEGVQRDDALDTKIAWLRQATEWREDVGDAIKFVDSINSDVLPDQVYVFTPKGDVVGLPQGSTPVDFAYEIHSEIGHRCRGAKVDGRLVFLDYQLKTGEQVEVLTAKTGGPSRDWLNPQLHFVGTQRAQHKIRQWFRKQEREANITEGRQILERELQRLGYGQEAFSEIAGMMKFSKVEDLLAALGYGDVTPVQIAHKIDESLDKSDELKFGTIRESTVSDISVLGVGDLLTRLAPCCNPVPGDAIVGYITRGRGVTVHRADCPNVTKLTDIERLVTVTWGLPKEAYPVVIRIEAWDRSGLLRDVASVVADLGISMIAADIRTDKD